MSILRRAICRSCGQAEMVTGSNCAFRCSRCRPHVSAQQIAHAAVARAIRLGELRRPSEFACEDCGAPADRYDHRDYGKPLQVAAVCRRCNARRGPAASPNEQTERAHG